ncbi:MAG: Tex family protein, partial [Pseudomonadota bacterium]
MTEPADTAFDPVPTLAAELNLPRASVSAVVKLLAESSTVPFIARYRKEATGGLDEVQIRAIEERRTYLVEMEARRKSVIAEIASQGKLTPELAKKLAGAATKAELEDLYLPFKPKRRTRATIAKERGLEPLADLIWAQGSEGSPGASAQSFVSVEKEVPDISAALAGARDICAERIAEDPEVRKHTREAYVRDGSIRVTKTKDFEDKTTKFDSYAEFQEPIASIPSHRYLAIRRGESEGVLRGGLDVDQSNVVPFVEKHVKRNPASPWANELSAAIKDGVERLLLHSVQVDVRVELKMNADKGAIDVFAQNLRELLLSAPFGTKPVLGIDPGQRTGCKCAMVDATGKLLEHETIYLVQGDSATERAKQSLRALLAKHSPAAVAVGNGTHGRETEAFVRDVIKELAGSGPAPLCVAVSEAGASVYSASDVAREEFPDLDLTVRGAVSIARRLQDPLAELVKVDPKSIGVGQYQHDVFQPFLAKKLDEVVESCVNSVGVEVNLASAPLLSRVAGIGPTLAKKIVAYRNEKGAFTTRSKLLEVPGLGPRTYEQAAGFLRVHGSEHPLDTSAVHPERYALVEKMAADLGVPVVSLIGNRELLGKLDAARYQAGDVGTFTINDILSELTKPGRDPRASFEPPKFRDDVRTMEDLKTEMVLEGVVTNVTAFGAFVDIGVHQDGLVHVSQLSDRFIKDPNEVVKVGDKLSVRVLEIDLVRKRIALSAKRGSEAKVGGASGAKPVAASGGRPDQNR